MNIITHRIDNYNVSEELETIKQRILKGASVEEKMKWFNQLCEFEYGRWMLVNRGLNAYWASYLIYYDEYRNGMPSAHPLEKMLLENSPGVLSSRERAAKNLKIIQNLVKENMSIASIPCALMNDFLRLDYKNIKKIKIVGIDLDPAAIQLAKENSKKYNLEKYCGFKIGDAWKLGIENEFDIIHSSGLNMYVQNEADLLSLYTNFYKALKIGGNLVVSANVPPMDEDGAYVWNVTKEEMDEIPLEAMIFTKIIQIRQGMYCTRNQIIKQLKSVGFSDVQVDFDTRKIFLSFIAKK
jgi:hypothetical protein